MVLDHADPAGQHADLQDIVASLEHAVVETILDGRPMEGITWPELLEHSLKLLDTTLDGGLVEKISDWELPTNQVPDTTLDGRLMEETTYLECSALGVSLDSRLIEGTSSLEPLEQSVLNTLLVARPVEEITKKISDWGPVAHPVPDTTLDGRLMEGTTYLERSALGVSLDSELMEGMSVWNHWSSRFLIRCRPHSLKKESRRSSQTGNQWRFRFRTLPWTVDLWRGLLTWSIRLWGVSGQWMAGMSHLGPFEQSVLGTWLVARHVEVLTETDTPECSSLASQVDYGHSKLELSARPILDINQDGNTEMDTDPSERSALATHVDFEFLHVESLSRPMVNAALDRRPMEGITAPLPVESSGLALAPDRGHVEYLPSSRPLEHVVMFHALGSGPC